MKKRTRNLVRWLYRWIVEVPEAREFAKWQIKEAEKATDEFASILNFLPQADNLPAKEYLRYRDKICEIRRKLHNAEFDGELGCTKALRILLTKYNEAKDRGGK